MRAYFGLLQHDIQKLSASHAIQNDFLLNCSFPFWRMWEWNGRCTATTTSAWNLTILIKRRSDYRDTKPLLMTCTTVKGLHHPKIAAPPHRRGWNRDGGGERSGLLLCDCGWVGGRRIEALEFRGWENATRKFIETRWFLPHLPCYNLFSVGTQSGITKRRHQITHLVMHIARLVNQAASFLRRCKRALEFSHHTTLLIGFAVVGWISVVSLLPFFFFDLSRVGATFWLCFSLSRAHIHAVRLLVYPALSDFRLPLYFSQTLWCHHRCGHLHFICASVVDSWHWLSRERNLHVVSVTVYGGVDVTK
jgi:hypothetical protein